MEYYSAITKNGIMPFAATWMDLEIIILNTPKVKLSFFLIKFFKNIFNNFNFNNLAVPGLSCSTWAL